METSEAAWFCIIVIFLYASFKGLADMFWIERDTNGDGKYKHIEGKKVPAPTTGIYGLYHRTYELDFKEKFPLSATKLVFLTDYFHHFDFWRNTLVKALVAYVFYLSTGLGLGKTALFYLFIEAAFSIGFFICYTKGRQWYKKRKKATVTRSTS